ncbi:MAG: hypothetical protein HQ596_08095 [Candidatus Saganbacteria bacterium]|nr:hypothetical protein [Candidatus Saganbacteria bacterium]
MKKIQAGILFGVLAGVIDVIPMLLQGISWDANLSAFSLWVVAGFMIATSSLKINSILKGILISFLILLPAAIIIAWAEPVSLVPISIITLILGGALGYIIDKVGR